MPSSPTEILLPNRPSDAPRPAAVTDGEHHSLLVALAAVPDPRDPRGTRYPLVSMLAVAVCAVLAGACTFAAITDWVRDLDRPAWGRLGFTDRVPTQLGSLDKVLFVADALHAQTDHAEQVAARGGHLMVPVKGNQPTLCSQLKALPWAQVPVGDRRREVGHGRKETRTVKAVTVATPGGLGFPHAEQAVRITRTRTIKGKTTREAAYMVVSLPAEHAQPTDLGTWARSEWHIENRVHYVRDVTLREDAHQAQTGNGPAVFATLRNTSIGYHRSNGETNIARATRRANHRPHDLIDAVTRSNPTTQ